MRYITAYIKPSITEITFSQDKLQLSDDEIADLPALKEYVNMYYVPAGFEVTSILISNN